MSWLDALNKYLARRRRDQRQRPIICALVETTKPSAALQAECEVIDGWLFEERQTLRGDIALHLFPSVV